jgi:hypothetical protein
VPGEDQDRLFWGDEASASGQSQGLVRGSALSLFEGSKPSAFRGKVLRGPYRLNHTVTDGVKAFEKCHFQPMYPDFLPRGPTNIRLCGFH